MTHPIEFQGERVLATLGGRVVFSQVGDKLFLVPDGVLIQVCGWCARDGWLATVLKERGYQLSHGICQKCDLEMRAKIHVDKS